MAHFFRFLSTFYFISLQGQNKKKRKKALSKVWEPCQLVLCNSSSGNYNSFFFIRVFKFLLLQFSPILPGRTSLLRNSIQPPCMYCMFEISPQIFNNIQVWGLWRLFQNLHLSFLDNFEAMLGIIVIMVYPTFLQLQLSSGLMFEHLSPAATQPPKHV